MNIDDLIWMTLSALAIVLGAFGLIWVALLALTYISVRSKTRMRVRPEVKPATLEHLPITFRPTLGQRIAEMDAIGFLVVANVVMQEEAVHQQTTQCLLINRQTQERGSIICRIVL